MAEPAPAKPVAESLRTLGAGWFSRVLREGGHSDAAVTHVDVRALSFGGAASDMARIHLRYDPHGRPGPASVIAKTRGADATRQAMDAAMNLFAREARFYTEFAARVPLRTPRCFHAGDGGAKAALRGDRVGSPDAGSTTLRDEETLREHPAILLLEDLGHLRMGDQVQGMSVTDAGRTMDALADLHAAFWERPEIEADWLVAPSSGVYAGMVVQLVGSGFDALRKRFADRVPNQVLDAISKLAPRWGEVLTACAEGPQTLAHNDTRLDNLFFEPGGTPVFVDWQIPARTRGTQDVGNLLAGSMNTPDLTANWEALLRRYHDRLLGNGVRHYSFADCREHYRRNILYPLGAGIALLGHLDTGDSRGLGDAIILRALHHCAELDAFSSV